MRTDRPFCHQHCELVTVPIFPGDLLPFAAVITGDPMWEKGKSEAETSQSLNERSR